MSFDLPHEKEAAEGNAIEPGRAYGFFTDTTLCIGCKACEVACKEWNQLPAEEEGLSGMSYDNTRELSATTWRHVAFVEQMDDAEESAGPRWLMMSDVCKHCDPAPCLEACPTGAIFRTEFDSVVVQQDVCNGCGYCVPACPFGVIDVDEVDGKAHKCTLCYDRLKGGREPACAQVCPTDSIQFGPLDELIDRAEERTRALHARGESDAYLYGTPDSLGATDGIEKLNAFFLLKDRPEVYNLPAAPSLPSRRIAPAFGAGLAVFGGLALAAVALMGGERR